MYKLLIADDEPKIRKGLSTLFPWKELGFAEIYYAANGLEAIDQVQKNKPDLCLVDICMPLLNGLDFIESVQTTSPETVCIVVSGFDEFDYAKKALQLGVFDYILKPVQEVALHDTILRALEQIRTIEHTRQRQLQMRELYKMNSQTIREQFIKDLVCGVLSAEEIEESLQMLEIQPGASYGLIMARLPAEHQMRAVICIDQIEWTRHLLQFSIQNIVVDLLKEYGEVFSYMDRFQNCLALVVMKDETGWKMVSAAVAAELENILHLTVEVQAMRFDELSQTADAYSDWMACSNEGMSPVVRFAQRYLETHFHNPQLTIQEVANQLNVSVSHLSNLFSLESGMTLIDYLTRIRVQEALTLLETSNKRINEISQMVGYNSQHYFCTVFKRLIGLSPSEYRQSKAELV